MAKSKQSAKPAAVPPPPAEPERYVCIHGHFYQPPRENPWLETVEVQDSAAPYHDWNDRITAECYAPNGASRITDRDNRITRIMNNYSRMSFNFGPTLLSWLCDFAPRTYRMVLDADRISVERHSGHGSAMAQVYNHIIMPLASERDALTQIRWGISDFEFRFGRKPEGMWLAETAVSRKVLDLMAREGIKFTILAPHQCARVRRLSVAPEQIPSQAPAGSAAGLPTSELKADPALEWMGTPDSTVNTTRPYLVRLDEGRSITIFFYDGPTSRAIAFEGLLNNGETFGKRLLAAFPSPEAGGDRSGDAMLSHVATDGESYGHHHRHGEMALSYAMHWLQEKGYARMTNYGEFLMKFPPRWEAEVVDDTSWSCSHGIERWRSNCGCNSGRPGWTQQWRGPLRNALDMLRDATATLSEELAASLFHDLWAARDAYIRVILDRQANSEAFLSEHQSRPLTPLERVQALELMELQRHAQLMYTSCGWFFDEVSGIETVQVIAYAGRVLQLAAKLFGEPGAALEAKFLEILEQATSNIPDLGNGAEVYRRYVTGMKIGLEQVGAHYAISSIFRPYPEDGELFCYNVHRVNHEVYSSGRGRIAIGGARIFSRITEETEEICYAVLHLGDQNLSAAVRRYDPSDEAQVSGFQNLSRDISQAMRRANLPEVIRLIDHYFNTSAGAHDEESAPAPINYSLTSLFADEEHRIVQVILNQTVAEMEESLNKIYNDHASLLDFLTNTGITPPPALEVAANFAINAALRKAIEADPLDPDYVMLLVERASSEYITLNVQQLSYIAGQQMKHAMIRLEAAASGESPANSALANALAIALLFRKVPFEVNLWQAQNIWNDLLRRSDRSYWTPEWSEDFRALGEALNINVDQLVTEDGVSAF